MSHACKLIHICQLFVSSYIYVTQNKSWGACTIRLPLHSYTWFRPENSIPGLGNYIYISICIYVYIRNIINIYLHTCVYLCIRMYLNMYMHINIYIYVNVYIYECVYFSNCSVIVYKRIFTYIPYMYLHVYHIYICTIFIYITVCVCIFIHIYVYA